MNCDLDGQHLGMMTYKSQLQHILWGYAMQISTAYLCTRLGLLAFNWSNAARQHLPRHVNRGSQDSLVNRQLT